MRKKRISVAAVSVFCITLTAALAVAASLWLPQYWLIISLLCVVLAVAPFIYSFEASRPKAAEIVCISVMAAAAVVGRWIFAFLPSVQPATAIIIIAGCAFGPSAGFMTGAATAVVSNMLLGQGMYTPWQMLCWGLCGAVGGLLYNGRHTAFFRLKPGIAFFGFAAGLVYGQIMNLQFFLGFTDRSLTSFAAAAVASIPTDLLHGACNAVLLFALTDPVTGIFKRIKLKYR